MKSNVITAAVVGLVIGIVVELLFAFAARVPLLSCLVTPVAWLFGLGLPIFIGALAAMFAKSSGLMTTPNAALDGAAAAALAELVSQLARLCLSLATASRFFSGPRFLLPSVEPAAVGLFSLVWALGWFAISLIVAAILGALGGFSYRTFKR